VLDPITLSPRGRPQGLPAPGLLQRLCCSHCQSNSSMAMGDTYNLNPATPRLLPWHG